MALDNLISANFTAQEIADINAALETIETIVKGKVINLTPEERQLYGKINNRTENWISKVNDYMLQKPDLVPFYLDKAEFDKDLAVRRVIIPILNRITSLHESLDDTAKLLSTDVYNAAIAYYRNIKLISMQNVAGTTSIYQDLAEQFPGRPTAVPEKPKVAEDESKTPDDLDDIDKE